jgi:hypothetical protein
MVGVGDVVFGGDFGGDFGGVILTGISGAGAAPALLRNVFFGVILTFFGGGFWRCNFDRFWGGGLSG